MGRSFSQSSSVGSLDLAWLESIVAGPEGMGKSVDET
jgi:hypothetical protein